ncbi:ester cyclase [Sinorhizobium meliloti]|uniref:ester cyclase n=1 Tax=Rhizobium meliloti TaxID=382 RepID=UPI0013E39406|nr:ester cyclase [Sinorhizobium meliloti]MCO5961722.1 ester cyclase [Sinorhizobium meliloti]
MASGGTNVAFSGRVPPIQFCELAFQRKETVLIRQLADIYRAYLDCLNRQAWDELGHFVDNEIQHNGRLLRISGYREMLVKDFEDIPNLQFNIQLLVCEPPRLAARLSFNCSPKGEFLGLSVNGQRVSFTENVFYEFVGSKIVSVWSIIDKSAIEAQLSQ